MYAVEMYAAVRRFVLVQGNSRREAARVFGISRTTVEKMCAYSAPPGYQRTKRPAKPKLDPFITIIDAILKSDAEAPKKQRHTAKRIFERIRDEHGYDGGYTIVADYVREARQRTAEKFVPLHHPPGHAQVDFGEAIGVIGGERCKLHVFFMDLPYSDAAFMKAYPAETTEAFLDGHVWSYLQTQEQTPKGNRMPNSATSANAESAVNEPSWLVFSRLQIRHTPPPTVNAGCRTLSMPSGPPEGEE